ncbi:hypothetical protein DFH09DRAFT_1364685 [Mycena vulgaris]|nr:hypothetical protein DFH09DRAFT_1364685 [Mycena vulgaris]
MASMNTTADGRLRKRIEIVVGWSRTRTAAVKLLLDIPRAGPTNSELHLYKIDIEAGSVSYLVHLDAPGGLVQLDLRGNYLAAICHSRGQIITLHSFESKFSPDVAVLPKPVIRLDPRDPVSHSSFTILSLGRFLVAGCTGISIYEIPEEVFAQPNGHMWWALRPWEFVYKERDTLVCPPMGPLIDAGDGTSSIMIPSGSHIRCVTVPSRSNDCRRRLVDCMPPLASLRAGGSAYIVGRTRCHGSRYF